MKFMDKIGAVGALLGAAAVPRSLPGLAVWGAALGLGAHHAWPGFLNSAIQLYGILALPGQVTAFCQHRQWWPLAVGAAGAGGISVGTLRWRQPELIYRGLVGLVIAALGNWLARWWMTRGRVQSRFVITCPHCGHRREEAMLSDACLFLYAYGLSGARWRPYPGECRTFCFYGLEKCPPVQIAADGCSSEVVSVRGGTFLRVNPRYGTTRMPAQPCGYAISVTCCFD